MDDKKNSKAVPLEIRLRTCFKVVTADMHSLGLRRNPNIITYPVGEWYSLPETDVIPNNDDFGGIWVTHKLSDARKITKYMMKEYSVKTRIFKAYIGNVLFENSYRLKTDRIFLDDEIHF